MNPAGMDGSSKDRAFEQDLLRAADLDVPPAGGKDRLRVALAANGVCIAVGTVGSSAGAVVGSSAKTAGVGTATVASATAASPAVTGIVSGLALAKWVAAGVVVGSFAVGTATVVQHRHSPSSSSVVQHSPAPSPSGSASPAARAGTIREQAERDPNPPLTTPDRRRAALEQAPQTTLTSRPQPVVVGAGESASSAAPWASMAIAPVPGPSASAVAGGAGSAEPDPLRLAEQVALLDAARRALNAHNVAEARRLVERYQTEFPRGELTPEAELLRQLIQKGRGEPGH